MGLIYRANGALPKASQALIEEIERVYTKSAAKPKRKAPSSPFQTNGAGVYPRGYNEMQTDYWRAFRGVTKLAERNVDNRLDGFQIIA